PRRNPTLAHRARRPRREHRPRPRAVTPARVPQPPVHDPGDPHLPVDLLTALRTQELKLPPAAGTHPLPGRHVMDLLGGLQMRVVPPAVPLTPRLLTPRPHRTGTTGSIRAFRSGWLRSGSPICVRAGTRL